MASGLPVITTAVGGILELVDDHRTGYLIPSDDGGALRRAVELLVETASLRTWMGAEGRAAAVRRFTAAEQVRQLLAAVASPREVHHATS
jgi:glycosyltransferase involved in cell wall biosynthesis